MEMVCGICDGDGIGEVGMQDTSGYCPQCGGSGTVEATTPPLSTGPIEAPGSAPKRARCHECGRFVSKKELAKVPTNGVPWCDECVSACDSVW